jgi:putative ABC transport system substrate-binding protein
MSYAADRTERYTRVASIVYKILKGAKPADLPIEQPTKFDFVINLKTAKALGVKIPSHLLMAADKVIE